QHFAPAVVERDSVDNERWRVTHEKYSFRRERMRWRKIGTPTKAMTMPTGITAGLKASRPMVSATNSKAPPEITENGMSQRWSAPIMRRATCGPTKPMKPITPVKLMTTAASITDDTTETERTIATLMPSERATSSPAEMSAFSDHAPYWIS